MKIAYVGFTTCELPECEEYMTLPKAPINYKDPVKIAEYISKALEAKKESAKSSPLLGFLQSWCILDQAGNKVVDNLKGAGSGAGAFPLRELNCYDIIIGYKIFEFLDMAVIDHVLTEGNLSIDLHWAKLSKMNKFPFLSPPWVNSKIQKIIFDPVDALCGQDAVENPLGLAKRLGLKDVVRLDSADEIARLSFLAGSKFFTP